MNFFKTLANLLALLLRALFYGWVKSLVSVARKLWILILRWLRKRKIPERQRNVPESKCVPIRRPEFHQPDPLIYAQYYLMGMGLAVTWDNPDIVLEQGGVFVPSSDLKPDTDYDIVARVWNGSTTAPVAGLPVRFSFLTFGIGTTSTSIGSTAIDLGVKGGPNHPAFARLKWRTPALPGHYCIQVFLDWFDDTNPNNNLGQENTQVGTAQSPVDFSFKLRNSSQEWHQYRFETDSYSIPELPPCSSPPALVSGRRGDASAAHRLTAYPVPSGWTVEFKPPQPTLAPQAEMDINVRITPAAGFTGIQAINVNAFDPQNLTGGVTLYVRSS